MVKPITVLPISLIIVAALFIVGPVAANLQTRYSETIISANANQLRFYEKSKADQLNAINTMDLTRAATKEGSGFMAQTGTVYKFFFETYHSNYRNALQGVNLMRNNGAIPDCLVDCKDGIRYFADPTTIITSQGRGVEQCLIFGATLTDTCTASNFAKILGWSVSTATPVAGDTWAGGAGVACSSTNVITDGNGLASAAATVTPGANGATVTTTLSKLFSITGTYTAVQVSCVLSALAGGTNPLIYAEGTFGPDSFVSGDSITPTWQIART